MFNGNHTQRNTDIHIEQMFEQNKIIFNRNVCFNSFYFIHDKKNLFYYQNTYQCFFIIARRSLGVVDIPSRFRFKPFCVKLSVSS